LLLLRNALLNSKRNGLLNSTVLSKWEWELISSRTKRGLDELKKRNVKLGSPKNLTNAAREKGVQAVIRNRQENENWKMARVFIEHFHMKNGYLNNTEISKQLNFSRLMFNNISLTLRPCQYSSPN
jgi:DNA invertase Pin-like site-specific DNA recombinase